MIFTTDFQIADPFLCMIWFYCWFLIVHFLFQLCVLQLWFFFFSLLKFWPYSFMLLLQVHWASFKSLSWALCWLNCLLFFFGPFSEVMCGPIIWNVFLCLLILPNLCIYFCMLDMLVTLPGLEETALCRRCPMDPAACSPLVTRASCSRNVPV